ncbi:rod-binding protein [Asaia lannensis]|nr:rod-binding protein [Asaia lannensis]
MALSKRIWRFDDMTALTPVTLSSLSAAQSETLARAQEATRTAKADKARETARSFEGLTLGELLQPMFDTADISDNEFGGGAAEKQFRSLQVLEMGKQIANNGGIGIADSVYRQILAMQEHEET